MFDLPSPQEFLLNLLLPPLKAIANHFDALAAAVITFTVLGGMVCFFGWLIRTGRLRAGADAGYYRLPFQS